MYVEVLGSNNGVTFSPIASAKLPILSYTSSYVEVDIYEDVDNLQSILNSTTMQTLTTLIANSTVVTSFSSLSSDSFTVLYTTVSSSTNIQDFYVVDKSSFTYQTIISSRNYSTAVDSISTVSDNIISDTYKACRVLPCTENYDDIILFSNGRIYFIKESNEYKSVIKSRNYKNFGLNAFSLAGDEYIQASTINKELYKVLHDIFTLKNNIIGRFSGKFDTDGKIVLDDYNYNVDFLDITSQVFEEGYLTQAEFEKYYINENEKSIVGVFNRVLANIYTLQSKLFEVTQTDAQLNIIPIYNSVGSEILE